MIVLRMKLPHTNPTPTSLNTTNSLNRDPPPPIRTVALTTPTNYASRLIPLIQTRNWVPLWCPTIFVDPTPTTLIHHLLNTNFSSIAFTSRAAISAVDSALSSTPCLPLSFSHELTVSALGKDSDLLTRDFLAKLSSHPDRVRVLVPPTPTPAGLVDSLGPGSGRRILCPVPRVVGLTEPPVVPNFLRDLELMGWVPVRVEAYETRWAGPKCMERLFETRHLDGLIVTSTAEVEGLLKGLSEVGLSWKDVKEKWPKLIVAAHGPVTAHQSEILGLKVDVVSLKFSSFDGVIQALDHAWRSLGY